MAPDFEVEGIDEAATDPPAKWVGVALVGIVLAGIGLVAMVLGAIGLDGAIVSAVPVLAVLFEFAMVPLVVGAGLFVLAMTEWEPKMGWH